jgi:aminopeptidase
VDEKIGGTVHLALGRSYPETGGVNESAVHWDLICDLRRGGRLLADGEVIQEDGRFVDASPGAVPAVQRGRDGG